MELLVLRGPGAPVATAAAAAGQAAWVPVVLLVVRPAQPAIQEVVPA